MRQLIMQGAMGIMLGIHKIVHPVKRLRKQCLLLDEDLLRLDMHLFDALQVDWLVLLLLILKMLRNALRAKGPQSVSVEVCDLILRVVIAGRNK
jgi:hypothetical protein